MIFSTAGLVAFAALALAAPQGSKHNVYLAHCDPTDCPIGLCSPGDFSIAAVAYYTTSTTTTPSAVGKLSGTGILTKWEGVERSVTLARTYTFKSQIDATATTAVKGGMVGNGTLTGPNAYNEPYACFKDGTTKFAATYDTDAYTCTADYWCGSTDVGKS